MNEQKLDTLLIQEFYIDKLLFIVCGGLLVSGYIMVASAALHLGVKDNLSSWHYPLRQFIHIVLGLIAGWLMLNIRIEFWEKLSRWMFLLALLLLIMVFIPGLGVKVNGSVRWLSVAGIRVQVSEMVKLIAVLYIAGYVTRYQAELIASVRCMLKAVGLFSIAAVLLLLEPDFGSAVVIMVIALGVMFLGGAKIWQFLLLIAVFVMLAFPLVYFSPYRWARITSFVDPWADPYNSGFQLIQALISFGQGQWFGLGLGNGIQKLFYLPEGHTDFLFSVVAEEFGLMGVLLIVTLFTVLVLRAFTIGEKAEKAGFIYSSFVAYGLGIWFGFQSFVNMGVNMGILPTKGLTLPLMSYGGGSMIVMCSAMALLLRINHEVEALNASVPKGKPEWASA